MLGECLYSVYTVQQTHIGKQEKEETKTTPHYVMAWKHKKRNHRTHTHTLALAHTLSLAGKTENDSIHGTYTRRTYKVVFVCLNCERDRASEFFSGCNKHTNDGEKHKQARLNELMQEHIVCALQSVYVVYTKSTKSHRVCHDTSERTESTNTQCVCIHAGSRRETRDLNANHILKATTLIHTHITVTRWIRTRKIRT